MQMEDTGEASLALFSLGSNLGDRITNLKKAIGELEKNAGARYGLSGMYESPAWGYESEQPYINCCLALMTKRKPGQLMELALDIEKEMGRKRSGGSYTDRIIDIDLLLVDDMIINQQNLILPHPRMHLRKFVLVPLAEIVPDMIDPQSGLKISSLLQQCNDTTSLLAI